MWGIGSLMPVDILQFGCCGVRFIVQEAVFPSSNNGKDIIIYVDNVITKTLHQHSDLQYVMTVYHI